MTAAPFRHPFTIPFHEVDAAGVLFFGHLFSHYHEAWEALLESIGHPLPALLEAGEVALPIAHAEADFHRPIRHGERLCMELRVEEIGERRFTLEGRCVDEGGQPRATLRSVHVAVAASGGPAALPPALRQALEGVG